jgi:hypothetical protein
MKKVVPLFYSNQKKCYEIWSSYDASLELTGWREQYKVPIIIDELFTDFIGSKKSYVEFKEALPDILDDRTLYYVVVTYFTCFNMMYINDPGVEDRADQVLDALNISANLKYDERTYQRFFHHLFPPQLVQNNNDVRQLALF